MFDIPDEERCLVEELEDVELKCTRLMSLENIVGGPNITVDTMLYTIHLFQIAKVTNAISISRYILLLYISFQFDISNLYISVSQISGDSISCKRHTILPVIGPRKVNIYCLLLRAKPPRSVYINCARCMYGVFRIGNRICVINWEINTWALAVLHTPYSM